MKVVFADSFFFFALLSEKDVAHQAALKACHTPAQKIVTTAWVLTEVADGLSNVANRVGVVRFLNRLANDPDIRIVPPTQELFDRGLELFSNRQDKDWSLTDCISFIVMSDQQLTTALTADHHFEQAGFQSLLKPA